MSGGKPPIRRVLDNSRGADFVFTASIGSGTFPVGTTARIEIYEPDETTVLDTWNGEYATQSFSFYEVKETAAALPDFAHYRLYVTFPDAPAEFLWYFGDIRRIG